MKLVGLLTLGLSLPALACPGLEIGDAWIREAPPGVDLLAGYATLRNAGKATLTITVAGSPDFGGAMLHRTTLANGMSRMTHLDAVTLKPGEEAVLQPGGLHIMLSGPARPLRAGQRATVRFECEGRGTEASFAVKAAQP